MREIAERLGNQVSSYATAISGPCVKSHSGIARKSEDARQLNLKVPNKSPADTAGLLFFYASSMSAMCWLNLNGYFAEDG